MLTKQYILKELALRIKGIRPGVETTTDFAIGELKSVLMMVGCLPDEKSEIPKNQEEAVKWLVDDDYHELTEKGRFILGSVGIGYNGYYIPYSDLLKLPKEDGK